MSQSKKEIERWPALESGGGGREASRDRVEKGPLLFPKKRGRNRIGGTETASPDPNEATEMRWGT